MTRYLVVANQTIGGDELMDEIRRRIASGPSSFYVLVPMMPVARTSDYGREVAGGEMAWRNRRSPTYRSVRRRSAIEPRRSASPG